MNKTKQAAAGLAAFGGALLGGVVGSGAGVAIYALVGVNIWWLPIPVSAAAAAAAAITTITRRAAVSAAAAAAAAAERDPLVVA